MQNLDLSILEKVPEQNLKVILEIEPLAPLSMVSELPGSFYKSLKSPSKKMICGLFENVLGWHIDIVDRKLIQKDLIKIRQKGVKGGDAKKIIKKNIESFQTGSTYIPLLYEYFEIELPFIPSQLAHYDDLWSRAFRRSDSHRHTFGTRYMDTDFIEKWNLIKAKVASDTKRKSTEKNTLLDKLFKRYMGYFPMYYSTPTRREYTQYDGNFQIKLSMDESLFAQLTNKLVKENIGYLGSNEGWVHLTIKEFTV
ncbi:CRISPR-associated protein Cas5, subtype PGING [Mariniphaga anaerophila]|uniref:CRISPR-associated protein Cas5, subtype PGING n=1 Tax=Mariniphaga anaerophila TaxID=1484053 RepID=A0A1M4WR29_9BACT|nr:type I-PGING CRISPR-associated protein Cas5p [Mariniphaga anaerophila]SHE83674.1 CRISPR-associated protein Cas5, subtype PGING [Mariniphaga anaerophila]